MNALEFLPWFLTACLFGVATWFDWKTRKIPNIVWTSGVLLACILALFNVPTWKELAWVIGICMGAFLLWFLRVFGGADSKALMTLSLLLPHTHATGFPVSLLVAMCAFASLTVVTFIRVLRARSKFLDPTIDQISVPLMVNYSIGLLIVFVSIVS